MSNVFKRSFAARLAALTLAAIFVFMVAAVGCKLEDEPEEQPQVTDEPAGDGTVKTEGNPVVISSPHVDYTLYDFRNAYYGSQDYMYVMYGLIDAEEYFNNVVDNCCNFMYIYNAAVDAGVELDAAEREQIESEFDEQLEYIISNYANDVDESVTDEAQRREEAIKLLNEDLESDGLNYDTFIDLASRNMRMNKIVDKFFTQLQDEIEVTDEDVESYIEEQMASADEMTMDSFRNAYEAYCDDQGFYPVYVPDDCFSVDHIFLKYETSLDDAGGTVYELDSVAEKEAELERRIPECADYAAFMELETEYGDDPGMDAEGYRENGYLIHSDFEYQYFEGFIYAAMNLYYGSWNANPNPDTGETYEVPELKYFELKDGTRVVKAATQSGVHYIIVNKTYAKGPVEYEKGDAHWLSWTDGAKDKKFGDRYESLLEGWKDTYEMTVHTDVFKREFVAAADAAAEGDDDKK